MAMLNIDYNTPRKFMMSFGLALIVVGFIVFFSAGIFMTERVDKLGEVMQENNSDVMNLYDQTHPNIISTLITVNILSMIFIFSGILILLIGILIWVREENPLWFKGMKNNQKPTAKKEARRHKKKRNLIEDIDKKILGEILLIIGGFILADLLVRKFMELSTDLFPWFILPLLSLLIIMTGINLKEGKRQGIFVGYSLILLLTVFVLTVLSAKDIISTWWLISVLIFGELGWLIIWLRKMKNN